MIVRIRDDGVLEQIAGYAKSAPQWIPGVISKHMRRLGPKAVARMREAVHPHRYTGALEDSIAAIYSDSDKRIEIYPSAMRGKWDAGLILELGTRPIPRAPYRPIATWAAFRGAPMPGAWLKIRLRGVFAHPFLNRAIGALAPNIEAAAGDMAQDAAMHVLWGRA